MTPNAPPAPQARWWRRVPYDLPAWSFWLIVGSIALGAFLRMRQFAADSSLWLDELALANNIAERSLATLLREPLAYSQVAPLGFVLVAKATWLLFGASDRALRFYSLVAGIGSLAAISLVSLRLGLRESAWVAPFLLALGGSFVFQSAQVKPYAGDVLFSLALVAAALRLGSEASAPRAWPAALGAVAPWFSFPAAFTLAGIGAVLLVSGQRRRLLPVVALWAASVLAAVVTAAKHVHADTFATMQLFWSRNAPGFPSALSSFVPWTLAQLREHLWSDVGLRGVTVWLGVVGLGALFLGRRTRIGFAVMTAPIVVAIVAAALHRYPFGSRVSHWVAAFLIVLIASATDAAARALRRLGLRSLTAAPGLVVAITPITTFWSAPGPYRVDHVKPVLTAIARARRPDDWLYVYHGAWHAYRYYGALSGIPPQHVVLGHCPITSLRESLASLDQIRGRARVWVLFAHVTIPRDREHLIQYLDRIGIRHETFTNPDPYVRSSSSVDAHLYDLSDVVLLQKATWQTFSLTREALPNEQVGCLFGMVPTASRPAPGLR